MPVISGEKKLMFLQRVALGFLLEEELFDSVPHDQKSSYGAVDGSAKYGAAENIFILKYV